MASFDGGDQKFVMDLEGMDKPGRLVGIGSMPSSPAYLAIDDRHGRAREGGLVNELVLPISYEPALKRDVPGDAPGHD